MPKYLFFYWMSWAFGSLVRGKMAALYKRGYWSDALCWTKGYDLHVFRGLLDCYDYIVTCTGGLSALRSYGIPFSRVKATAHGVVDLVHALQHLGNEGFDELGGFSVIDPSLALKAAELGIRRKPAITCVGHEPAVFDMPLPDRLRVAGYASTYHRVDEGTDVDIKRGVLARKACERAKVEFRLAGHQPYQAMHGFYRGVDCVLMSSISEGDPLPMIEGAMSGRLCIGTPVGAYAERATRGAGLLAPLDAEDYVNAVAEMLVYYREHPKEFRDLCARGRELVRRECSWDARMDSWIAFLTDAGGGGPLHP